MLVLFRKATVDIFGRSATNDAQQGTDAESNAKFDTAIWAAWLAVAYFVPEGYPQLVTLSGLGLYSFASILCACQRDP